MSAPERLPRVGAPRLRLLCQGAVQLHTATLAITGATGFLGGYLVGTLLSRGARVIAVVRNPAKAEPLARAGAEIRRADLSEPDALRDAFSGCDAVIHNAAAVSFTSPQTTHKTNVDGTRNVFEAIAAQKIPRAIAISSASAYPASPFVRTEQHPLRKGLRLTPWAAYGSSKAEAERMAWDLCRAHDIALTTFRPCGISGAHDPLLMGALEKLGRLPIAPVPVFTEIGVVHATDVAEAVARALELPIASNKAYNLQGSSVSLWRIIDAYRKAGGRTPRLRLPIPFPFLLRYDDSLARKELGFSPRSLESVCADAVSGKVY